jgi:hypothetical protein
MQEKKKKMTSKPFIFVATTVFLLLGSFVLVAAQEKVTTVEDIGKAIGKWISDAFGYTDIKATSDWRFVAVLVVIFFMLFFAFSDIIYSFTTFKKTTAYILGFGLAVIAALTKGVLWLSRFFFGITAALGALAVAVIIVIAFVIAILMHWWILGWVRGKIREKEVEEYAAKVKRGMKLAALIEEGAEKEKK